MARAPSGGLGVSGCIAVVVMVGGTLYFYAFDVFVPKQASEASNWSAPAPRAAADPYDQTGCWLISATNSEARAAQRPTPTTKRVAPPLSVRLATNSNLREAPNGYRAK